MDVKQANKEYIWVFEGTNMDLEERWILHDVSWFKEREIDRNNWNTFMSFQNPNSLGDSKLQRTTVSLCEDNFIERNVIAKMVKYSQEDMSDLDSITRKRQALLEQLQILNDIGSNMLPEPLDYFTIENKTTEFDSSIGDAIKKSEPVLILDYISGEVLGEKLKYDYSFYYPSEDGKRERLTQNLNLAMVMRLALDILTFIEELYKKEYAYTSLSVDHIILLRENKPRFVGLGRICGLKGKYFNTEHVNFGRQLKGYSAPEMNQESTRFGEGLEAKYCIAYNFGVLLTRMLLGKRTFETDTLVHGAYSYARSARDRSEITKLRNHSKEVDNLLLRLMAENPYNRLTDFDEIRKELMILMGDEVRETKRDLHRNGVIKKIFADRGFGFVTDDHGYDIYFKLNQAEEAGFNPFCGKRVTYVTYTNRDGKEFIDHFVRSEIRYPRTEGIIVKETPRPTPPPPPGPQKPQRKKGLFGWLFG